MSVRPVRELPAKRKKSHEESYVARDVREFLRLGCEIACVESDGRPGKHVVMALRNYVRRHPDQCRGLKAFCRGGKAYLVREVTK